MYRGQKIPDANQKMRAGIEGYALAIDSSSTQVASFPGKSTGDKASRGIQQILTRAQQETIPVNGAIQGKQAMDQDIDLSQV